jgi:hypothetical protein
MANHVPRLRALRSAAAKAAAASCSFKTGYASLNQVETLRRGNILSIVESTFPRLIEHGRCVSRVAICSVGFTNSPELMGYFRNLERDGNSELQPFEFDSEYQKAGGKICDRRVVQAGYRLAAELKQIVH